jgi:two-component system sensor histidine kinase VicK
VAITVTPVILDRKIIGTIEVFRDITREVEIDKAKSEFVSLASHQLRTPLTGISWYTEMILRGDVGEVTLAQRKYLEEVYNTNRRMIDLVNTLLNVSSIELGTFTVQSVPTDICALAESVLEEQKLKIEQKKLIVTTKFGASIPVFLTDPKLLRMIFQNLLSNAVKYTSSGGKIEFVIFFDPPKTIRIQISDTGYGIPRNQHDQIFTKLFRADNVRSKDTGGTGLGLYIVKSTVENFGGKIRFESEENKGTTFYVTLPLGGPRNKKTT